MGVDTSIYANLLRTPKSVAEYDAEAMQGKQNKLSLMMQQAKMDDYNRGLASEQAEADAHRSAIGADGKTDRNKLYSGLAQIGQGAKLSAIQKGHADQDKAQREAEKSEIELNLQRFELIEREMRSVSDQGSYDAMKQRSMSNPLLAEGAAKMPAIYDPATIKANMDRALPLKDKLAARHQELTRDLSEREFTYKQKHDAEKLNEDRRKTNLTDSRVRAGQASGNGSGAPKGKAPSGYRWTENGDLEPITGGPAAIKAAAATAPKQIPASANKAILENNASLRSVTKAIADLDAYPEAFGLKNYVGDTIMQRADPKGVNARASTADIGSLKIHDRSGAAVTAAETPRLKPFIPAATDNAETARKKLVRFKQEYQSIQEDLKSTYSKEQGYRAGGGAAVATGIDALLEKYGD